MKHNFRELNIWKDSVEFGVQVYSLTRKFPSEEKYGLTSQLNRSSISISSNIAEGSGRTTNKEFSRFLDITLASSYEVETQLIIAKRLYPNFTNETDLLYQKLRSIQKRVVVFQRKLNP